jgi:hypothetical protein
MVTQFPEWIECGILQEHTGFHVYYATGTIPDGYLEHYYCELSGEGADGSNYLLFYILRDLNPNGTLTNSWTAYFEFTEIGSVTFTHTPVNQDPTVGGETNSQLNTLYGRMSSLRFLSSSGYLSSGDSTIERIPRDEEWSLWIDVSLREDEPFYADIHLSDLFTGGGGYIPMPSYKPSNRGFGSGSGRYYRC